MHDASPAAFASTLPPPPALSPLEVDAVLDVALATDLAALLKRCGCGRVHDGEAWSRLPYCGVQEDGHERFELRHCECGSTIAVLLCAVNGCSSRPTWRAEPSLVDYCEAHVDEWLRAERCPPHDFRDGDVCSKCDALRGRR